MIVDAHVHVWDERLATTGWPVHADPRLRRAFDLDEYARAAEGAMPSVDAVVLITADESVAETRRLVRLAERSPLVAGVVGWVDPCDATAVGDADGLCGIRLSVSSGPAGLLGRADVLAGLSRLASAGLVIELLVLPKQLAAVARAARALPGARIVVDHLGNPPSPEVEPEAWADWRSDLRALATAGDLRVKVSGEGMTRACVDVALEAFGAERLMVGSDWPVSSLRRGLSEELAALDAAVAELSAAERERILGATAVETYGLAS